MLPHVQQLAVLLMAQESAPPPGGCDGQGPSLLLPAIIVAILYFVYIVPTRRERKSHQEMLEALKRGDEVVTSSGVVGSVADISPKFITLEVARNVKIRFLKSAVARRAEEITEADKKGAEKKAEPKDAAKSEPKSEKSKKS